MYSALAPHQDKKKKLNITDVLKFPWENIKPKAAKKVTFDEAVNFLKSNQG